MIDYGMDLCCYMVDTGGEWQGGRYMQRKINYYNENKNSF